VKAGNTRRTAITAGAFFVFWGDGEVRLSERWRDGLCDCRDPSAPWPAFAKRERKKKPATPVGMTHVKKCEALRRAANRACDS